MLDNIAVFIKVVDFDGFTHAALELGMSQSTVSKKVKELEKYVGHKLIKLVNRKLFVTEHGKLIYEKCKHYPDIINKIKSIDNNHISQYNSLTQGVNILLPTGIAYEKICSNLHYFLNLYPQIKLNIIFTSKSPETINFNFDIALTVHKTGTLPGFDNSYIGTESVKLFCNAEYAEKYGIPQTIEELNQHILYGRVSIVDNKPVNEEFFLEINSGETFSCDTSKSVGNANLSSHIKLTAMNLDCIFGSLECMCSDEIKNGTLIAVLPDFEAYREDLYILSRKNPSKSENLLIKFLKNCIMGKIGHDLYQGSE